jgi:hypothetical protein
MDGFGGVWGFCGGWAIDLAIGRRTRPHKDVDVALLRREQAAFYEHMRLQGWTLEAVRDGRAYRWDGSNLPPPVHEIWCRRAAGEPSGFEALLNESEGADLLFRRERSVRLPLAAAFRVSTSGLPVLAPEVVLLYKAKEPDDEANRRDFGNVLPGLGAAQRKWLQGALRTVSPDHEWLRVLREDAAGAT